MNHLISLLGIFAFVGIAYGLSVNRRAIRWVPVVWGIALQLIFGLLILRTTPGFVVFKFLGDVVSQFLSYSDAGAKFVFGDNFEEHYIAFKVLPTIIFFSSFITILYHYGILQRIVQVVAIVMMKTMKTSGSESLSAAANIFVGQSNNHQCNHKQRTLAPSPARA